MKLIYLIHLLCLQVLETEAGFILNNYISTISSDTDSVVITLFEIYYFTLGKFQVFFHLVKTDKSSSNTESWEQVYLWRNYITYTLRLFHLSYNVSPPCKNPIKSNMVMLLTWACHLIRQYLG